MPEDIIATIIFGKVGCTKKVQKAHEGVDPFGLRAINIATPKSKYLDVQPKIL